ncbi:AMP-binding protein [Cystobacter fuscus]|uniref:AMP-binding protein n=1 Tax=Cystobacter fuscus TaxID=43 RepID=UPI0037BFAFD7
MKQSHGLLARVEGVHESLTLHEALLRLDEAPATRGFTFQNERGEEHFVGFPALHAESRRRGAALQALGMKKGDRLGMVIIDPEDFIVTFLGALRVGVVPVPLYPPVHLGNLESYTRQAAAILSSSGSTVLAVSAGLASIFWAFVDRVPSLARVVETSSLAADASALREVLVAPEDLVFLQYTSGSTGTPKGVKATHRTLIANIHGFMGASLSMQPGVDSGVSWLPLQHDMGLIGFVLGPLYWQVAVTFIPTLRFLKRPECWMETVHRQKATVSFAPNFAYGWLTRVAKDEDLERWSLGHVRALGVGAEPLHYDTLKRFTDKFARTGLRPDVLLPAYGLAESMLAISMKTSTDPMKVRTLDAGRFRDDGVSKPADGGEVEHHISCGKVIPGHELRVVDEKGVTCADGVRGEILFRGPSVMEGYQEGGAEELIDADGWLWTGDLGYLVDGELFVVGRAKDLIIIRGRNISPQTIEWEVNKLPGVRVGTAIAVAVRVEDSEGVVVMLETRGDNVEALKAEVAATVKRVIGVPPADVVCLPPGAIPKTSSGKLQRAKARRQYLEGKLGREGSRTAGSMGARLRLGLQVTRSWWARARFSLWPKNTNEEEHRHE